jgi:hypothetical protein
MSVFPSPSPRKIIHIEVVDLGVLLDPFCTLPIAKCDICKDVVCEITEVFWPSCNKRRWKLEFGGAY